MQIQAKLCFLSPFYGYFNWTHKDDIILIQLEPQFASKCNECCKKWWVSDFSLFCRPHIQSYKRYNSWILSILAWHFIEYISLNFSWISLTNIIISTFNNVSTYETLLLQKIISIIIQVRHQSYFACFLLERLIY